MHHHQHSVRDLATYLLSSQPHTWPYVNIWYHSRQPSSRSSDGSYPVTLAVLLYILSLLKLARSLLLISNYRQKLSKKDKACHKEIASTTHATSNMTCNSPPLYYVGNTAKCDSSHRDNQPISLARSLSGGKSNLEELQTRGDPKWTYSNLALTREKSLTTSPPGDGSLECQL